MATWPPSPCAIPPPPPIGWGCRAWPSAPDPAIWSHTATQTCDHHNSAGRYRVPNGATLSAPSPEALAEVLVAVGPPDRIRLDQPAAIAFPRSIPGSTGRSVAYDLPWKGATGHIRLVLGDRGWTLTQ